MYILGAVLKLKQFLFTIYANCLFLIIYDLAVLLVKILCHGTTMQLDLGLRVGKLELPSLTFCRHLLWLCLCWPFTVDTSFSNSLFVIDLSKTGLDLMRA